MGYSETIVMSLSKKSREGDHNFFFLSTNCLLFSKSIQDIVSYQLPREGGEDSFYLFWAAPKTAQSGSSLI